MASQEVRLTIGGITFAAVFPESAEEVILHPSYIAYVSDNEPDIFIRARYEDAQITQADGQKIFQAGPNWSMERCDGKFLVTTMFEQAICSADFRHIDLILPRIRDKEDPSFFFAYPISEIIMINYLAQNRGILLHSCGIVDQAQALLFCGMSGAGKSTLANLWEKISGVEVLSDDRIIVRQVAGKWIAYGTPWHGESGHCSLKSGPLSKMFFIDHAPQNCWEHISVSQAVTKLLARSFPPLWDKEAMANTLEVVEEIVRAGNCRTLGFVPNEDVIDYIKRL